MQVKWGQRGLCNKGTYACAPRATTPAWQEQQHQGNSKNMPANWDVSWGQRGQHSKDNNAGATRATMPVQCWQWCQHNKGNNTIMTTAKMLCIDNGNTTIMTRVTTPAWQCNDAITARATTLSQWQQRCLDCKDACVSMTATSSQQGQPHQLNNSKDACALMMATTILLQGQWHQLNDYASSTTTETPLEWGQQKPLQLWQRPLHFNCNNAITTRATTPSQ